MQHLPLPDALALLVAFGLWHSFAWLVERSRWAKVSLTASIGGLRLRWMLKTCERDQRIFDGALLGNLMHSISFLASATIILLGAVAALLGAADRFYDTVRQMPYIAPVSKELLELKLLALGLMFVYCFLKFTWSLRQFNYCCIVVGGCPAVDAPEAEKQAFAEQAARVGELGARSFNQGLRGYYFALAGIGWFIHPAALVVACFVVVAILWRREFHSKTRRAVRGIRNSLE